MSPPTSFNKARALEEATRLVSQKKISQAIKHYLAISERDPSDLGLLNTIGDLCIRDGNTAEALKQFQKLADAYTHEGFLLKAVAIRKKISKLAPNDVEPLLKLAEHYSSLGLGREAREHYMQSLALCEKQALSHKALEILRKLVKQEPENLAYRFRLADSCVALGQNGQAAQTYAEIAEIAYQRGELATIEEPLQRALRLDPASVPANLLSARLALDSRHADRAKQILQSSPALKSNPEAARLLLDAHIAEGNFDAASQVATSALREGKESGGILVHYIEACLNAGNPDSALDPLREMARESFERNRVETLCELLRLIAGKHPDHLPTLELLVQASERIPGGEDHLKAVEALSNAYISAGRKDAAESLYRQLLAGDPDNNLWQARLNELLQTGSEPQPASQAEAARPEPRPPEEEPENPQIEEAIENASIFARYGLIDKALEEPIALSNYNPKTSNSYDKLFEVSRHDRPARAARAAEAIATLLRKRGNLKEATAFEELSRQLAATNYPEGLSQAAPSIRPDDAPPLLETVPGERPEEFGADVQPGGAGTPFLASSAPGARQAASAISVSGVDSAWISLAQIDLTEEVEALASLKSGEVEEEITPASDVFAEEQAEIEFYLEYGFFVEARQAAGALAEKFPDHPSLPALQQRVEEATQSIATVQEEIPEATVEASPIVAAEGDIGAEVSQEASQSLMEKSQLTPPDLMVEGPEFAVPTIPLAMGDEAEPQTVSDFGDWIPGAFDRTQPPAETVPAEEPADHLDLEWSSTATLSVEEPALLAEPELMSPVPASVEDLEAVGEDVRGVARPSPVEELTRAPELQEAIPEPSPVIEPSGDEATPAIPEPPRSEELAGTSELETPSALIEEPSPVLEVLPPILEPPPVEELSAGPEMVSTADEVPVEEAPAAPEPILLAAPYEEQPPSPEQPAELVADQIPEPPAQDSATLAEAISGPEPPLAEHEPQVVTELPAQEVEPLPISPLIAEPEPVAEQETEMAAPLGQPEAPTLPQPPEAAAEARVTEPPVLFSNLQELVIDSAEEGNGKGAAPADASPLAVEEPSAKLRPTPHPSAASFREILQELSGDLVIAESPDSPEKHYNLGLAFREMDLIDEAIGEFQKVVRGSVKANLPPRFLESCSLLASCFMQKGMPSIAVKWYQRALDVPGVEGDAFLALNYDLADAMDRAGQGQPALEKFMEVYSENIDYRDVADRIRALQHSLA